MIDKRRPVFLVTLALVLISAAFASSSSAEVLAQSTFDTDGDGWLVKDLAFPNPGAPPIPLGTFTPAYHGSGGNPGGYVSFADPTANAWYWYAPAKFLGNKQSAYGGKLSFDLAVTGTGAPFVEEDVILVGGGLTLVFALPAAPVPGFTSYHIGLTETGWRRDTRLGVPATAGDMTTALSALTGIYIRGEYRLAMDDVGQIDNIILEGAGAICEIELNQAAFVNGEQVVAQVFRIGNSAPTGLAIEWKIWFEAPGISPIRYNNGGADGSVVIPAGLNVNLGPTPLFTVSPSAPRGTYVFGCRMLQPTTGALLTEDLNTFEIQ